MKKRYLLLFLLLILPISVFAEAGTEVKTLEANKTNNTITFNGTTQDDTVAVMCKLYDNEDNEIDMLSVEVEDNKTFEGSFVTTQTGTFNVACANYEGGDFVIANITVDTLAKLTVEFNTKGGSTIDPVQVTYNDILDEPENPTKEGKVFAGWYQDDTLLIKFDFDTHITNGLTLYAKWDDPEEVPTETIQLQTIFYGGGGTYQVDFAADDSINPEPLGEPVNSSHRYFVGEGVEVTLTATPAQGYHLKGWYNTHEENDHFVLDNLVSNQTTYTFTPEGEYVNLQVVFEENNNDPEMFTVEFNTNGGSEIASVNVESGQTVARPADPTKDGKVFIDWYEDQTLTNTFDFNTPITADTTIYAAWGYTVTFNTNGGSTINQVKVKEGDKVARPTDPTKVENNITKIFENWYDDENLEHDYNFDDQVNENITLYAKWLQEYSKTDADGNELEFTSDEDKNLQLIVTDLESLTDEQLLALNPMLDRETFNALLESLTEEAKRFGTVISFLDISVYEGQNVVDIDTEVNLKLAITDEMGDYKYYKLVYVDGDDNGNIFLGNAYDLSKQGNKLTGRLPHLSTYVLVGSNTSDSNTSSSSSSSSSATTKTSKTSKNPVTSDNIYTMFIVFGVSLIGILFGTFRYLKVRKVK